LSTHKDLDVWKLSMNLVEMIYELTKSFPKEEQYGLKSQMRRSAVSVPSNISEGAARKGNKEYIQFLYIALGSLSELETQLLISIRLKYCDKNNDAINLVEEIRKKLLNFIKYFKNLKPINS
jgi:four helix bundle protein